VTKIQTINRVSSQSLHKHTRRTWDQWIAVLDRAGARDKTHQQIVALLKGRHKLTPWWQQIVAIGYGIHTGKRLEGQNQKGGYSTTATKTFRIGAKAAWELMLSPKGLALWLNPLDGLELKSGSVYEVAEGAYGQVRTLQPGKRIRLSWQEAHWPRTSFVQMHILPRPNEKSMAVISHDTLATAEIKAVLKERWRKALDRLSELATPAQRTASPLRKPTRTRR
jgi:uncharacterized protein YndB with AHSA1/START domain